VSNLPERTQQILSVHAELIRLVVNACGNLEKTNALEPVLKASENNGWTSLVERIRKVLSGHRDPSLLNGLDEEDRVIVDAILRGLQDPSTLAQLEQQPIGPEHAAPGIALMIYGASHGDPQALQMIGTMAQQMMSMGDDMAKIAGRVRALINGEREPEILCKGMQSTGEKLMLNILAELKKMEQKPQLDT
jgi:hypothetical protein